MVRRKRVKGQSKKGKRESLEGETEMEREAEKF